MNHARNMAALALIKRADMNPALTGGLIGAGVGGVSMGLLDYLRNKKKDQALNSGLLGAALGGIGGAGIGHIAGQGGVRAVMDKLQNPENVKTELTKSDGTKVTTSMAEAPAKINPEERHAHGLGAAATVPLLGATSSGIAARLWGHTPPTKPGVNVPIQMPDGSHRPFEVSPPQKPNLFKRRMWGGAFALPAWLQVVENMSKEPAT